MERRSLCTSAASPPLLVHSLPPQTRDSILLPPVVLPCCPGFVQGMHSLGLIGNLLGYLWSGSCQAPGFLSGLPCVPSTSPFPDPLPACLPVPSPLPGCAITLPTSGVSHRPSSLAVSCRVGKRGPMGGVVIIPYTRVSLFLVAVILMVRVGFYGSLIEWVASS